MDLLSKKCIPCEGAALPLIGTEAKKYLAEAPSWQISDDFKNISREFKFPAQGGSASGGRSPFLEAMVFVNKVAELSESEGHHPYIYVFYNHVKLELSTHAIGGLSENDFILAAKINHLM